MLNSPLLTVTFLRILSTAGCQKRHGAEPMASPTNNSFTDRGFSGRKLTNSHTFLRNYPLYHQEMFHKAWFCCETSTVMELVFLPFIYSWWTSTYQRHIASLCQLRNNFFSKISHKAQYYQLTLKISTKKEPLISQKSQTLRFYLYFISPNCTILA